MASKAESGTEAATESEDDRFEYAHGTVMILAWIVFASTAILYARYGRTLRFGSKEKLLGEKIWFQIHRLVACLTTALTLLGFFFILVQEKGKWAETDEGKKFVHSVLGGIVVCCALIQAWMALFRCHPDGSFRFIYNWLHRLTGVLAFFLSIPTIFLIVTTFENNQTGMIIILSIWSAWVVLIVIVLEIIRLCMNRLDADKRYTTAEQYQLNEPPFISKNDNKNRHLEIWSVVVLIIFLLHFVVSIALAIPLIVLIWK